MAAVGPGDFRETVKNPAIAYQLGQLPTTWPEGKSAFGHWNKRSKDEGRAPGADHEWVGEDSEGVWIKRDPHVALLTCPGLWPVWAAWEGGQREMQPSDIETMSAYHYTAKLNLAVAKAREDERARNDQTHQRPVSGRQRHQGR